MTPISGSYVRAPQTCPLSLSLHPEFSAPPASSTSVNAQGQHTSLWGREGRLQGQKAGSGQQQTHWLAGEETEGVKQEPEGKNK